MLPLYSVHHHHHHHNHHHSRHHHHQVAPVHPTMIAQRLAIWAGQTPSVEFGSDLLKNVVLKYIL